MGETSGNPSAVAQELAEVRTAFGALGVEPDMFEAQAAEARVRLAVGQREEACRMTKEVWHYLRTQGPDGLTSASWVYLCIADVLNAAEIEGVVLAEVLDAGHRDLMAPRRRSAMTTGGSHF